MANILASIGSLIKNDLVDGWNSAKAIFSQSTAWQRTGNIAKTSLRGFTYVSGGYALYSQIGTEIKEEKAGIKVAATTAGVVSATAADLALMAACAAVPGPGWAYAGYIGGTILVSTITGKGPTQWLGEGVDSAISWFGGAKTDYQAAAIRAQKKMAEGKKPLTEEEIIALPEEQKKQYIAAQQQAANTELAKSNPAMGWIGALTAIVTLVKKLLGWGDDTPQTPPKTETQPQQTTTTTTKEETTATVDPKLVNQAKEFMGNPPKITLVPAPADSTAYIKNMVHAKKREEQQADTGVDRP